MGILEPIHLVIIAVVILVFFGPKKIPELMRGLGKGMGELQKGINEGKAALQSAMTEIEHHEPVEPVVPEKVTSAAPGTAVGAPSPTVGAPKDDSEPKPA